MATAPTFVPASASDAFPFDLRWNAQQLADAVPLRLFELVDFDALRAGADASANQSTPRRRWQHGYLANAALPPLLRVR